ncbi:MAG: tRNA (adenosine(37)-N6)-threonylcarbamoyltransferase complex ATPase subunit type 1 TsaE [Candidatus Nanopelagicales bacterium]
MTSITIPTGSAMRDRGAHVARCCRPGDLVILSGDLGAGKTTFVQGMGAGLGVSDQVTSPTFVIARVYPTTAGPDLVHVDAYRLGSSLELDDLDLDSDLAMAITVVEWWEGKVEQLSEDRVVITIVRSVSDDDETRVMSVEGFGPRWDTAALQGLLA